MIRTKPTVKPALILVSDIHLREDCPTCFTGDWHTEQWTAVAYLANLQREYDCYVLHAGDLFHHWKPSPWLLSMAMTHLPEKFISNIGQHDAPSHNLDLMDKSGIRTLEIARKVIVADTCHYGQTPSVPTIEIEGRKILAWHKLAYITEPYPGATGGNAMEILKKYPQFSLICTGDNHCSFSVSHEGRLLVNPGNLTRQTSAQIDYQPRVALWFAETNTIKWVNVPISEGTITREHLEVKEQRDERINAFVERLDGEYEVGLSFEQNLEAFFDKNKTEEDIKQIIYTSIE